MIFSRQQQRAPNQRQGVGELLQNITSNKQSISTMANKGVNGLSKTLGHVQQVMQVVDSAAPVVQEYGPMVKNLPAMYRVMKAFKENDNETEGTPQPKQTTEPQFSEQQIPQNEGIERNQVDGESKPKLFI